MRSGRAAVRRAENPLADASRRQKPARARIYNRRHDQRLPRVHGCARGESGDRRRTCSDPGRPGLRQIPHRPHGVDRLRRGPGLARRAGHRRTARSSWIRRRSCCTTRRRCSKASRPTAGRTGRSCRFAPDANAARLRSSARRLAIPELPDEVFIESLRQLIAVDDAWVPPAGGEEALYLRPFIIATEPGLGVRPAKQYRYLLIASPAGAYFKGGIKPGQRLGVDGVRAGQPGRHRCGQVRRQLRGVAAGAGRGRRTRLRPGGVAGRRRAPLRRRDGRDEPVLRVRQRRVGAPGHSGAVRLAAARHHPGFVAAVGN